jgi:CubicO group peptidase (beta-lactamase class C family)
MAIVGVNFYLGDGPGRVKLNDSLILPGDEFVIPGLVSDTDFPIYGTNVDGAGNESDPSIVLPASTLQYVPPGADSPVSSTDATMIDTIVAEEMALSKAPGVSLTLAGPRGKYSKAYGKISATGRALTTDDRFRIASSTKSFTSTAVLMAVERGDLSLDDTLDQFVPNVPRGDQITLRHMMMMRSGIYDYQTNIGFLIAFTLMPTMTFTDEAILLYVQGNPSQFVPGTAYQYTNSNYVLLGMVLKAVTGRPVKQIIAEDILAPLGLVETRWPGNSVLPPPAGGVTNWDPSFFSAAGALASTVGDMLKWAAELRDSTLLGPEMNGLRRDLFVGYPSGAVAPMPSKFGYGLGMESTGTWLGHNGTLPGWDCQLAFDTVSGALIAVAENMQTVTPYVLSAYTRIFARIADYLYPGSMAEQNYTGTTIAPPAGVMSLVGGRPVVSVTVEGAIVPPSGVMTLTGGTPVVKVVHNKLIQPPSGVMTLTGGIPGSNPIIIQPPPGVMTLTGGTPVVTLNSFTPFNEENFNRINRAVPAGTTGCYVTLLGGGGGGGSGRRGSSSSSRPGGKGGGGAAKVMRTFIPVASLGPTYSLTCGAAGVGGAVTAGASSNGNPGTDGGLSQFASGSITMTAGGGVGGQGGAVGNTAAPGGTASVSGISASTANGTAGGAGTTSWGADNTAGAAAGGGAGSGYNASGNPGVGGVGGDTTTGSTSSAAGAPGPDQAPGDPGPGGGGGNSTIPGGDGGDWGGGGAGGGAQSTTSYGGDGGSGYCLVEWV